MGSENPKRQGDACDTESTYIAYTYSLREEATPDGLPENYEKSNNIFRFVLFFPDLFERQCANVDSSVLMRKLRPDIPEN